MYLDERGAEQGKTAFYSLQGCDTRTGYPTRKTLEGVGLKHVADLLQAKNKLG
jgi:aldehyde:ferredoxin oxidoreductase